MVIGPVIFTIVAAHRMALWEENHKWFSKEFCRLLSQSDFRGLLVPAVEVFNFDNISAAVLCEGGEKVAARTDLFVAQFHDNVSLAEPGLVRRAARLDAADPYAVVDGEVELLWKGRGDLLDRHAEEAALDAPLIDQFLDYRLGSLH